MLDSCIGIINRLLPEPHASLLAGMLFGVRRSMPDEFYNALITTGTLHVIALSGMNISIITRILFDFLGSFLGRYIGTGVTIGAIVLFIIFVGPSESIVRAGIMGSLTLTAVLFGRKDIPLISLVLTILIMFALDHDVLTNVSFQLSVGATLGILLFANNTSHETQKLSVVEASSAYRLPMTWLHSLYQFVKSDLRVTLSAQIFTIPLILFYFHRVSIISPVSNIAIGWLVAPITYLGFLMVFAGAVFMPLAYLLSWIIWVPLTIFVWIVEFTARIPFASLSL